MQSLNIDKFLKNDNAFNIINREFTTLKEEDIKQNNRDLQLLIDSLLSEMKEANESFRIVNPTIFYGGSFYKETKYGKPEEFDLNINIRLPSPINQQKLKFIKSGSGFVKINSGLNSGDIHTNSTEHRLLRSILDDDMYINQTKFRQWMEGIFSKTHLNVIKKRSLNNVQKESNSSYFNPFRTNTPPKNPDETFFYIGNYKITYRKSGPAFTVSVKNSQGEDMSLDLVPVLEFSTSLIKMKQNLTNFNCQTWFAVPKPFYVDNSQDRCREWRMCFYNQEKEILKRNGPIKPVIRQLKKLRDNEGWYVVCSYFIEMVALNYLKTNNEANLDKVSRSTMFFKLLNSLHDSLQNHSLPWYWDDNFNLLDRVKTNQLIPIAYRLNRIIKDIEKNIAIDKLIMAKYILNEEELQHVQLRLDNIENGWDVISTEEETGSEESNCTIS